MVPFGRRRGCVRCVVFAELTGDRGKSPSPYAKSCRVSRGHNTVVRTPRCDTKILLNVRPLKICRLCMRFTALASSRLGAPVCGRLLVGA